MSATNASPYSQRSAKKTLIFVIVLLSVALILAVIAIYLNYKQTSVMVM